jgi:HEPN domain-containing protein
MSIENQIEHWQHGAWDALESAEVLFKNKQHTHALFFCHLAVEKMVKTLVMKKTGELAPKIHNLIRLAEIAEIQLPDERMDDFGALSRFNLAGRYIESIGSSNREATEFWVERTKEIMIWLKTK